MVNRSRNKKLGTTKMVENSIVATNGFTKCKELNGNDNVMVECRDERTPVPDNAKNGMTNGFSHDHFTLPSVPQQNGHLTARQRKTNRHRSYSKGSEGSDASAKSQSQRPCRKRYEKCREIRLEVDTQPMVSVFANESPQSPNVEALGGIEHDSLIPSDSDATPSPFTVTSPGLDQNMERMTNTDSCGSGPSEPVPCCSTKVQTDPLCSDGYLHYISTSEWDQTETMCEIVSSLDAFSLRLFATIVESHAIQTSPVMRTHEIRANDLNMTLGLLHQIDGKPFIEAINIVFSTMALLHGISRRQASIVFTAIRCLFDRRKGELIGAGSEADKRKILEKLGQLIVGAVHHPAFNVEHKVELDRMKEQLRADRESYEKELCLSERMPREDPPPSSHAGVYITRFVPNPFQCTYDNYSIEIKWSDGEVTYTNRTRHQLNSFHFDLLDRFGNEEKNGLRVLPCIIIDKATVDDWMNYIEALSDLPARIMMSETMLAEFHGLRQSSPDISSGPSGHSEFVDSYIPPQELNDPNRIVSQMLPQGMPFVGVLNMPYPVPVVQYQMMPTGGSQMASCSNCAGPHNFLMCPCQTPNDDSPPLKESEVLSMAQKGLVNPELMNQQLPYNLMTNQMMPSYGHLSLNAMMQPIPQPPQMFCGNGNGRSYGNRRFEGRRYSPSHSHKGSRGSGSSGSQSDQSTRQPGNISS